MPPLERVSPEEAVQMYLTNRKPELSQSTIYEHRCRLNRFIEWVEATSSIEDLTEMTRQKAFRYKTHRIEEVAATTVENEMRTFRLFLRFCENYGCCPEGVASSVDVPTAPKSKRSRDVLLEAEQAEKILEYLEKYEYCTFKHALFALMWHAGARIGGIRALDLDDFHPDHPDGAYLEFVHRPETETPLKNDWKSERKPAISEEVAEVLSDYVEACRPDVTDKHGREPLLATKQGRPAKSTIQRNIYALTRPCVYTDECPHDREIDECEATGDYNTSMKCPSSRSPHALRRGRATTNANNGMPREMTCDRLDMSEETAEEHYLRQSEKAKRKLQREYLND